MSQLDKRQMKKYLDGGTVGLLNGKQPNGPFEDQVYATAKCELIDDPGEGRMLVVKTDNTCPVAISDKLAKKAIEADPNFEAKMTTVSQFRSQKGDEVEFSLYSSGVLFIDKMMRVPILYRSNDAPADPGYTTCSMGRVDLKSIYENAKREAAEEVNVIGTPNFNSNPRTIHLKNIDFSFYGKYLTTVKHFIMKNNEWILAYEPFKAFVLHDVTNNTYEITLLGYFDGKYLFCFDNEDFNRQGEVLHVTSIQNTKMVPVLKAIVEGILIPEWERLNK